MICKLNEGEGKLEIQGTEEEIDGFFNAIEEELSVVRASSTVASDVTSFSNLRTVAMQPSRSPPTLTMDDASTGSSNVLASSSFKGQGESSNVTVSVISDVSKESSSSLSTLSMASSSVPVNVNVERMEVSKRSTERLKGKNANSSSFIDKCSIV
jgi:hypothetical protein